MRSPSNTETTHLKCFIGSKMPPKLVKSTDRDQNLIRWSGYSSIWYFRPFPHAFSRKCPKTLDLTRFTSFFGLCDLEICHMTLKIWEPKAVGVSKHLIKYQGNRWRNMLAKAGRDRQTDGQFAVAKNDIHYIPQHRTSDQNIREKTYVKLEMVHGHI